MFEEISKDEFDKVKKKKFRFIRKPTAPNTIPTYYKMRTIIMGAVTYSKEIINYENTYEDLSIIYNHE